MGTIFGMICFHLLLLSCIYLNDSILRISSWIHIFFSVSGEKNQTYLYLIQKQSTWQNSFKLYHNEKKWFTSPRNNVDEFHKHNKWEKSNIKAGILYESIYQKNRRNLFMLLNIKIVFRLESEGKWGIQGFLDLGPD